MRLVELKFDNTATGRGVVNHTVTGLGVATRDYIRKMASTRRCLYFAYGSNLSRWRVNINVPSAVFHKIGYLEGYKLSFRSLKRKCQSGPWRGAVATILPDSKAVCYGVIWAISECEVPSLDSQEFGYKPISVQVQTDESETAVSCRTYIQVESPVFDSSVDRPSPQYLDCIVRGAKEHSLPQNYIDELERIEHNSYKGSVDVRKEK